MCLLIKTFDAKTVIGYAIFQELSAVWRIMYGTGSSHVSSVIISHDGCGRTKVCLCQTEYIFMSL